MELQQLKSFTAVAKYKSFSVAANKIYRTQPAVSLQVKSLEKELSVKLFDRLGPRKIALTEDGKTLLGLVSPLISDVESLPGRFNEMRGLSQKGSVRIATHTSVMTHLLPKIVGSFRKKFPDCELSIGNADRKTIFYLLNNGDIDIGITWLATIPENMNYKVFARFERVLIAAKDHPIATTRAIKLKDIAKYPLILPPAWSHARSMINEKFKQENLSYKIAMEIAEKAALKEYVKMNLGIAIIDGFYLTEADKEKLFCKKVEGYFGFAESGILTLKNKYLSRHMKEFISFTLSSQK